MKIDYQFKDKNLLKEALTHPSFSKRAETPNYQRLEFLGDTVLSMIMAEILMKKYETENEGELSKRQAYLVSGEVLAQIAQKLELGDYLQISEGEENAGGRENKRNLENAMEALIAAIYLDSDLETCRNFVIQNWEEFIDKNVTPPKDPISTLQEIIQGRTKELPNYQTNKTSGDDHRPIFTSILEIEGEKYEATGTSKKEAQKNVAIKALERINHSS